MDIDCGLDMKKEHFSRDLSEKETGYILAIPYMIWEHMDAIYPDEI